MAVDTYMDYTNLLSRELEWKWKLSYMPLHESNLMNLCDVPVFLTTGEVARYTKFLINRVHIGTLWMDKEYHIHVEDIH